MSVPRTAQAEIKIAKPSVFVFMLSHLQSIKVNASTSRQPDGSSHAPAHGNSGSFGRQIAGAVRVRPASGFR
jgi:hypothetical protein